jgi:hypothetical protein
MKWDVMRKCVVDVLAAPMHEAKAAQAEHNAEAKAKTAAKREARAAVKEPLLSDGNDTKRGRLLTGSTTIDHLAAVKAGAVAVVGKKRARKEHRAHEAADRTNLTLSTAQSKFMNTAPGVTPKLTAVEMKAMVVAFARQSSDQGALKTAQGLKLLPEVKAAFDAVPVVGDAWPWVAMGLSQQVGAVAHVSVAEAESDEEG